MTMQTPAVNVRTPRPRELGELEARLGELLRPGAADQRPAPVPAEPAGARLFASRAPAIVWTTDRELTLCPGPGPALTSQTLDPARLAGLSVEEVFGVRDPEFPPLLAHRSALAGRPSGFEQEWQGRLFQAHVEPLYDDDGGIVGTIGIAVDVTERKQVEEALHREKERALVTLASIGDGVIRTDAQGRVDYMNPVAEMLTGWNSDQAHGRMVAEVFAIVDELTRKPLSNPVERCLEEGRIVESPGHALLVRADEMEFAVRDSAAPIRDRAGEVIGSVLVFKDVTQLRGMEREMIYLASHDALTGLVNRREFENRLKRALRSSSRERRTHALLYLDLDEFKVVNDTCGHLAGDELLKQVTGLLRSRVRRIDTLARLGGDEFGVLLEDCPLAQARQIAEEMRRLVREYRFRWKGQIFEIGVSIGLVPITHESGDLANLLSAADAACYVAKDGGRNRVHEYQVDDTAVAERYGEMQWIHRIHRAFEEKRFRLYYQMIQPVAAEHSRELLCEVFIRMLDGKGRLINPTAFISAAERYHLIGSIDRWVVRTAFRALAEAQRRECSKPLLFAVNLSGQSLSEEGFLDYVVGEIASSGVDSRRICFEITETAAISKIDGAMRFLSVLKEMGCRFVLDDFGSGLSSFAYLRDLPVDFLKIDGEFVRDMVDDRVKRAMVESINQIGHVMGIQTIAEWVENRPTFDVLKEIGVDYAQGFWLAKPQPLVHDI